jgi:uncharacterized small protein (DUF1192 family)
VLNRLQVVSRTCKHRKDDGAPCAAAPLRDEDFCLWHHPDHADVVAEGRRLGGSRRKKEATVSAAYDFEGTGTVEQIGRVVDIAILDTLALENGVNRNRTLGYLAQTAVKLRDAGDLAERIALLEATLLPRLDKGKRR